ncbi:hypothetical protein CEW83_15290 [Parazoarcus communis]|uniref:Lipoprotein n=1 Tax=Parazoarcus communis TaxID=41977 RepID=A0A2U8GVD5_9RHOO|nr:hypothetical protein [Parazoarcus communis]AWI76405.1 hypothetical protein CEW83_15290 [Parazoarcus communis]
MKKQLIVSLMAAAVAAGCATPSTIEGMVVQQAPATSARSTEAVNVTVIGGKDTSTLGASQISSADFAAALSQSVIAAGLFPRAGDAGATGYSLEAFIATLSQPMFGMSFTVEMEVSYKLIDRSTRSTVWAQSIKSAHTATAGDSLVGVTRLRLANEGAARKNIEAAIAAMGKLPLR